MENKIRKFKAIEKENNVSIFVDIIDGAEYYLCYYCGSTIYENEEDLLDHINYGHNYCKHCGHEVIKNAKY